MEFGHNEVKLLKLLKVFTVQIKILFVKFFVKSQMH